MLARIPAEKLSYCFSSVISIVASPFPVVTVISGACLSILPIFIFISWKTSFPQSR